MYKELGAIGLSAILATSPDGEASATNISRDSDNQLNSQDKTTQISADNPANVSLEAYIKMTKSTSLEKPVEAQDNPPLPTPVFVYTGSGELQPILELTPSAQNNIDIALDLASSNLLSQGIDLDLSKTNITLPGEMVQTENGEIATPSAPESGYLPVLVTNYVQGKVLLIDANSGHVEDVLANPGLWKAVGFGNNLEGVPGVAFGVDISGVLSVLAENEQGDTIEVAWGRTVGTPPTQVFTQNPNFGYNHEKRAWEPWQQAELDVTEQFATEIGIFASTVDDKMREILPNLQVNSDGNGNYKVFDSNWLHLGAIAKGISATGDIKDTIWTYEYQLQANARYGDSRNPLPAYVRFNDKITLGNGSLTLVTVMSKDGSNPYDRINLSISDKFENDLNNFIKGYKENNRAIVVRMWDDMDPNVQSLVNSTQPENMKTLGTSVVNNIEGRNILRYAFGGNPDSQPSGDVYINAAATRFDLHEVDKKIVTEIAFSTVIIFYLGDQLPWIASPYEKIGPLMKDYYAQIGIVGVTESSGILIQE